MLHSFILISAVHIRQHWYGKVGGSEAHGEAACRILNKWSSTMKTLTGNADRFLASGIYGYELANAAEIMRDYPDFDKASMEKLFLEVFIQCRTIS